MFFVLYIFYLFVSLPISVPSYNCLYCSIAGYYELNCAYFFGEIPTALVNAFR